MSYSAIQHSDGRWGIYYGRELLATIGCQETCNDIILCLNSLNRQKSRQENLRERFLFNRRATMVADLL